MSILTWLKIGLPVLALIGLVMWFNGHVDAAHDAGVKQGKEAAEKVCKDETVPAAEKVVQDRCDANNLITRRTNHDLQTRLAGANAEYERVRKQALAVSCVSITHTGRGSDGEATAYKPDGGMGISAIWVTDAFHAADGYSARLLTLQETVAQIYDALGQRDKLPKEWQEWLEKNPS